MRSPTTPLAALLHDLRTWPQTSQEHARRNAMIAATACAQRRVERQEVDDFLASRAGSVHRSAHPEEGRARAE